MLTLRQRFKRATDPDRMIQGMLDVLVEMQGARYALDIQREVWRPGKPLKLLLVGYNGSRNTGSDIRPEEIVRQFRTILGERNIELSILTQNAALTSGYFRTARQLEMPMNYPPFLARECPKHHGVIAVEGSMFKSKFTDAVTTLIAASLGMASAEGKLSVGYGAEAAAMAPALEDFVRKHCRDSLVICRNEPSRQVLEGLGVRACGGTDTAWTFEASPRAWGAEQLRKAGWDGRRKVLALGPINPFWWPVRPDLLKAIFHRVQGQFQDQHYRSIYFHESSSEGYDRYERYIQAFAFALQALEQEQDLFPILIGMEQLDGRACADLQSLYGRRLPMFVSSEYNMYDLVSILQNSSLLVTSRFHALVTSMLAGVPSAGVSMDERINNLMTDRGHPHLLLSVEEAELGPKILGAMRSLVTEGERITRDIERFVPQQLKMLGEMGIAFEDELLRVYPEFPRRNVPRTWEHYLPPLAPTLQRILAQ